MCLQAASSLNRGLRNLFFTGKQTLQAGRDIELGGIDCSLNCQPGKRKYFAHRQRRSLDAGIDTRLGERARHLAMPFDTTGQADAKLRQQRQGFERGQGQLKAQIKRRRHLTADQYAVMSELDFGWRQLEHLAGNHRHHLSSKLLTFNLATQVVDCKFTVRCAIAQLALRDQVKPDKPTRRWLHMLAQQ